MASPTSKEKLCFSCFVLSCICVLSGFIMLICFGKMFVDSYRQTLEFSETARCTVLNSTYLGITECACAEDVTSCKSHFPCYDVTVTYYTKDGVQQEAMLYEDVESFSKRGTNPKCSLYKCGTEPEVVSGQIERWQDAHGYSGQQYACAYNPEVPSHVIRTKTSLAAVVGTMTVATVLLTAGIVFGCWYNRYRTRKARGHRTLETEDRFQTQEIAVVI